jgi:hypothetical protein
MDDQQNHPQGPAPTIDWLVAVYFDEICDFVGRFIMGSPVAYRFLWTMVFFIPFVCVIAMAVFYVQMINEEKKQNAIYQPMSRRKDSE